MFGSWPADRTCVGPCFSQGMCRALFPLPPISTQLSLAALFLRPPALSTGAMALRAAAGTQSTGTKGDRTIITLPPPSHPQLLGVTSALAPPPAGDMLVVSHSWAGGHRQEATGWLGPMGCKSLSGSRSPPLSGDSLFHTKHPQSLSVLESQPPMAACPQASAGAHRGEELAARLFIAAAASATATGNSAR